MARKVFFSFHYERDVRRIVQIRNSWVVRPGDDAQPFYDKAEFEEAKKRAGGIEQWIEEQLKGCSVTVVLFGAETYERDWVKHEILRSYQLGKGMLAIDIQGVKDPQKGVDIQGRRFCTGRPTMFRSRSSTRPIAGCAMTVITTCRLGLRLLPRPQHGSGRPCQPLRWAVAPWPVRLSQGHRRTTRAASLRQSGPGTIANIKEIELAFGTAV